MTVLRSGSATDVGRIRQTNEDLPLESSNLFAVADGMGGHVGGEVAARVAIDALLRAFTRQPTSAGLKGAFAEANRAVWTEGQNKSELRGMGTTLTAVALVGGAEGRDMLALANVGDSRAYVFSQGEILQVTADHSLAEERMRHGEMTEEEAAVHPQRHILTRVLGVTSEVETDMWELQLRSGDRVVLCSDGLSNEVPLGEIAQVLSTVSDPGEAAHRLVTVANEHGGSDNITAVVVDVLVGEEGTSPDSVVKPIGRGAGAPLVIGEGVAAAAPRTEQLGAVPPSEGSGDARRGDGGTSQTDTLAPGAQLGFTQQIPALGREGSRSGDFFTDNTGTVPLARSSTRATIPSRPFVVPVPSDESRGARRRRLGIPRRITVRVVLFTLLIAAVPTGAYFAVRWYAYDNWFVAIHGTRIDIEQGYPNGVLWFKPKVVDPTKYTTKEILPTGVTQIRRGVQEPTLQDAKNYVKNLNGQYRFLREAAQKAKTTTTTGVGPAGAIPNITTPPPPTSSTTTTAPPVTAATVATTTTTAAVDQTTTTTTP
ncbi:MAG TPA: Stp1/IreP family PP2C-type Ser/Thr phosphatase [Acidimicrobiales bacterium]